MGSERKRAQTSEHSSTRNAFLNFHLEKIYILGVSRKLSFAEIIQDFTLFLLVTPLIKIKSNI